MAIVKKPPESVNRPLQLERPGSELLDDYSRFVDCTPDDVANFALRKSLAGNPDYRKWKAGQNGATAGKREAPLQQPGKPL